jgi:hypothetical protein
MCNSDLASLMNLASCGGRVISFLTFDSDFRSNELLNSLGLSMYRLIVSNFVDIVLFSFLFSSSELSRSFASVRFRGQSRKSTTGFVSLELKYITLMQKLQVRPCAVGLHLYPGLEETDEFGKVAGG